MFNEPIHISDASFEKTVLNSPLPVIVDFWAPWCGPCRMVAPILDKLAKEYAGKILVTKLNVDENVESARHYGVQSIPTLLFFVGGKVIQQQVGALPETMLRDKVDAMLAEIPVGPEKMVTFPA